MLGQDWPWLKLAGETTMSRIEGHSKAADGTGTSSVSRGFSWLENWWRLMEAGGRTA
jgi:hypothetical protein